MKSGHLDKKIHLLSTLLENMYMCMPREVEQTFECANKQNPR
jgi:hypothetical protein